MHTTSAYNKMSLHRGLSTPRDAAMHLSYLLAQSSQMAVFEAQVDTADEPKLELLSMHDTFPNAGRLLFLNYRQN